jgi:(p)ppGpp synthase/HD superfamily hydrolase
MKWLPHRLHRTQPRKGTTNPYIAHLLAVTANVIESGGDEDEAIAALLHDGPEDQGGAKTLKEIRREFDDRVADIVEHCSDTFEDPKPEWWTRKRLYHDKLRAASPSVLLVSVADKVHNAEATANDLEVDGPEVWSRFKKGREGSLWNYATLLEIYREKAPSKAAALVDRLERALKSLRST